MSEKRDLAISLSEQFKDLARDIADYSEEIEFNPKRLDAVEERARNELGLIKPAEQFYQVVPPPPGGQQTVKNDEEN